MEKYDEIATDELFSLSEIYHEKSKMRYIDYGFYVWITYINSAQEVRKIISKPNYIHKGFRKVSLKAKLENKKSGFCDVVIKRKSVRDYKDIPLSLDSLANILFLGNGITHTVSHQDGTEWDHRTTPSGGGLYPVEIYCIAQNVNGLDVGVYFYSPVENCLYEIYKEKKEYFYDRLSKAMATVKEGLQNSGAVIMLAPYMPRMNFKYKERAYRFALLETGHIAQNMLLAAESENLGAVPVGGFVDDELNGIIKADGLERSVQHCILIGNKM